MRNVQQTITQERRLEILRESLGGLAEVNTTLAAQLASPQVSNVGEILHSIADALGLLQLSIGTLTAIESARQEPNESPVARLLPMSSRVDESNPRRRED